MIETEKNIERLSQKIFDKSSNEINYLLLTNHVHQQLLAEDLARTGLYQWIMVFRGQVKLPQQVENYNDYDIIQINLSGQDVNLVNTIKEKLDKDSKTIIVANSDYTTEMWINSFGYPKTFGREVKNADMLVGTEKFMCRTLSEITDRRVYEIPHPCDVKRLKSIKVDTKEPTISVLYHRYDNCVYLPHFAVRNHGLGTQIIGYEQKSDNHHYLTSTLYDKIYLGTNFQEFCRQMMRSEIIYEPFTFNSHGRATIDSAAMGIPTIGSNRIQSMRKCFPYTICDPYDTLTSRKLIQKILNDESFKNKVIDYALNAVEFYNHINSKERYLIALDNEITMREVDKK